MLSQLTSSSPADRRWTLQLDFCNTFNNTNRDAMFVEIHRRIPSISAWMESCYSCQPLLLLGKGSIHSCCGVQHGDPLGPLGFALSLHPLVERIKAEAPGLALNAWYLDDGTLVGSLEDLAAALHIVERDGPTLGLHLNRSKSLLFIPEEVVASNLPLPSDIPITRRGTRCFPSCLLILSVPGRGTAWPSIQPFPPHQPSCLCSSHCCCPPALSGSAWTTSTSLYGSVCSLTLSTKRHSSISSHLLPPPALEPWFCHLLCLMQATGST